MLSREEQNRLVEEHMNLVYWFCHYKAPFRNKFEYDELVSIASLALVKASRQYEPGKSTCSAYAIKAMENNVLCAARKFKRPAAISLSAAIQLPDGSNTTLDNIIPDPNSDFTECIQNRQLAQELLSAVDSRTKDILMAWANGERQCVIAKRVGISQGMVSRRIKHAIMLCKKECAYEQ